MTESHDLALSVAEPDIADVQTRALVLGVLSTPEGPVLADSCLDEQSTAGLEAVLADLGATGAADQLHRVPGFGEEFPAFIALIGLGSLPADPVQRADVLRHAAGSAVRQLTGTSSVTVDLPVSDEADLEAVAQGIALGAFHDAGHRTSEAARSKTPVEDAVIFADLDTEPSEILSRALVLGEAVDSTRRLVNEAPNHLYPETFAHRAFERVSAIDGVTCEILDEQALAEGGFGGILGVGQGSSHPPRLVVVDYAPDGASQHVALVGKGITFDSGGLSLKPANAMMTMKSDMGGAAAVLNIVAAAAELELPVRVTGYLCMAENLPSSTATRPEDVLSIRGGKTVEVLNTDAEGRLVMADGLAYASEQQPDFLLDIATLTGAQLVALGERTAGVMGEEGLRERVVQAARTSGEPFWPMPLPEHLRPGLDSPVADLKNIGSGRNGGMLTAGLFLREFVGENSSGPIPWAHLDIAGPSFNEGAAYGFTPQQGTGFAVTTVVEMLRSLCA